MADTEYKLPYTAEDIKNKLDQVEKNKQDIEMVRDNIPKKAEEVGAEASGTAESKQKKEWSPFLLTCLKAKLTYL